jgi:predicted chitinase
MLRMTKAPFFALCNLFRARSLVCDREGVTIEKQVVMFLHVVGHNQRFRVIHQSFTRSIETVHRHFYQVLYAIGKLRNEMIKSPSTAIHPKVLGSCKV